MTRPRLLALFVVGVTIAGAIFVAWHRATRAPMLPGEIGLTFDGNSDKLQRTAFVPTLDTPIPDGKSAVWCASFQLAWDKLKTDIVKGPVKISNAEAICDRLNKAGPVAD